MYSMTESISDAHCVQRLLLIFTGSMTTPDVYIKFFPERTYQLILMGRGTMKFSNKNISVLQNHSQHRVIKEFYLKIFTLYKFHSFPRINWCVPNETGHDSLQGCLLGENVMPKV